MPNFFKYLIASIFLVLFIGQANALSCSRSYPSAANFAACISPTYNPAMSLIDNTPMTGDYYARFQWNMRQILENTPYNDLFSDAPRDVIVAVIDTYPGSKGHPDLVDSYLTGINLVEGGTNADAPTNETNPMGNAHGQCVASIIASKHNTIGTAGVFHRAKILPIRASVGTLAAAIDAAVDAGAEVIHIAGFHTTYSMEDYFLYPNYTNWPPDVYPLRWTMKDDATAAIERGRAKAIRDAIEDASWNHNVIISTVIGNWTGADATVLMPSIHETVASSAVNVLGEPSPFNTNNYYTTILAPGGDRREKYFTLPSGSYGTDIYGPDVNSNPDDILCAVGSARYSWGSGGSFAGPHTAAAAAIIKSYLPNARPDDVRRLLTRSMQPIMNNLHMTSSVGGMLSLKRLKTAILAE